MNDGGAETPEQHEQPHLDLAPSMIVRRSLLISRARTLGRRRERLQSGRWSRKRDAMVKRCLWRDTHVGSGG